MITATCLLTMSCNIIMLTIIPTLHEGYTASDAQNDYGKSSC